MWSHSGRQDTTQMGRQKESKSIETISLLLRGQFETEQKYGISTYTSSLNITATPNHSFIDQILKRTYTDGWALTLALVSDLKLL